MGRENEKNRTIIFVRSNPVNPDPRVEKEAESLAEEKYNVKVLGWDREGNSAKSEMREKYEIKRFRLKAPYGSLSLFFYIFIWNLYEFIFLMLTKYDFVHVCDLDTAIPAVLASKIKRKKIVYDVFDFYAECLPKSIPKIVRTIIGHFEVFLINQSDAVIIVDNSRMKQLRGVVLTPAIVMNIPKKMVLSNEENAIKKSSKFLIFYAGILTSGRGLDMLVEIAKRNSEDIFLIIAGFGKQEQELKESMRMHKNMAFLGKLSYQDVLKYTRAADLLVALYDPSVPNHRYSSPNKLFEAMMYGKPILVSKNTGMDRIVKKEKCGLVVDYDNLDEIEEGILGLKRSKTLCTFFSKNAEQAHVKKYNWDVMKKRLINIYGGLR